jgi:hypothetical protein
MRLVQKSFSPIIKMSFPTREILYLIRNTWRHIWFAYEL